MLENLISKSQFAFVKGRQILDGFFVANEVIHSALSSKRVVLFSKLILRRLLIPLNGVIYSWLWRKWGLVKNGFPGFKNV